jgi:hypothetical protein
MEGPNDGGPKRWRAQMMEGPNDGGPKSWTERIVALLILRVFVWYDRRNLVRLPVTFEYLG